eukprot:CAMPEP_0114518796 /NCGR_PEP_ID=MMETSP0109-20121206/18636_1 /TAXON_ID=29199 /ORGANISM="Chlorarachnion reptans, Strain CCCM449" /LENGTH=347 /DNA_ID=CAMNT_0001699443 /DNA_START=769 /DNA_END=1808 /DNA_ORIENTATION=-
MGVELHRVVLSAVQPVGSVSPERGAQAFFRLDHVDPDLLRILAQGLLRVLFAALLCNHAVRIVGHRRVLLHNPDVYPLRVVSPLEQRLHCPRAPVVSVGRNADIDRRLLVHEGPDAVDVHAVAHLVLRGRVDFWKLAHLLEGDLAGGRGENPSLLSDLVAVLVLDDAAALVLSLLADGLRFLQRRISLAAVHAAEDRPGCLLFESALRLQAVEKVFDPFRLVVKQVIARYHTWEDVIVRFVRFFPPRQFPWQRGLRHVLRRRRAGDWWRRVAVVPFHTPPLPDPLRPLRSLARLLREGEGLLRLLRGGGGRAGVQGEAEQHQHAEDERPGDGEAPPPAFPRASARPP